MTIHESTLPAASPRWVPGGQTTPPVSAAARRLSETLQSAPTILFDDDARFVFFSDLHRGDDSPADAFRANKQLFEQALRHYYEQGYTYIEVGDGDELWKNRHMRDVRRAHAPIYALLHRFASAGRLHLLIGNHQLIGRETDLFQRIGLLGIEGLVLQHSTTGQRILVTHGHQADSPTARLYGLTRTLVRHVWQHLQRRGMSTALPEPEEQHQAGRLIQGALSWSRRNQDGIEKRIKEWLRWAEDLIIICGHTHRPAFSWAGDAPYFNTGSGIQPGYITGLEIANGAAKGRAPSPW